MEFRDLKTQYAVLKLGMDQEIQRVCQRADFVGGEAVKELEQDLADYVGTKHCITCGNGTDALQLALMAWGVKTGDAVFVPDFTFFATGEAPALLGAVPVFVDIKRDTFCMDVNSLREAILRTLQEGKLVPKVVITVDLFGHPADYDKIRAIADRYGIFILEDGAQGFGGAIGDQKACSFGDIATTSFFPAKPLGCYGDGGAIFTNNDEWDKLIRSYAVHGQGTDKYNNMRIGINSRLDTIQAAVLNVKLSAFRGYELRHINRKAELYTSLLKDIVVVPEVSEGYYSSWAQYTICLKNEEQRQAIQTALTMEGIPSAIYYAKPMQEQQAFEELRMSSMENSVCKDLCTKVLSLPISPYLTEEQVRKVCDCIRRTI